MIEKLLVNIHLGNEEVPVGELLIHQKKIYFKYLAAFLAREINISPLKMSFTVRVQSCHADFFEGLFGVFHDSLPDGWGRLLLDRTLSERGISPSSIGPLDRLAYVGNRGMGSLSYHPDKNNEPTDSQSLELDSLAKEMRNLLSGTSTDIIEELFELGGASGGARPKIFVGYNPQTDHIIHDSENLPLAYEHWIIKFPSSSDPVDIANIEYAYYQMAINVGIEMSQSKLFEGRSGKQYFGSRRFDRQENKRLHMHSACGIMQDNFRLSNMDYGNLMDCAFRLEQHVEAYEKVLRLAAFNIYSHNRDDHSKNVSFLMDEKGGWKLAPAYDLTFSTSAHGFHSMMVAGEGKNPGKKQLLELAEHFRMKTPLPLLEQVQDVVSQWGTYAAESGVRKDSKNYIEKVLAKVLKN